MKAIVLAAGYATRLYPLTKRFPKSLLKVQGKPVLNHILQKLVPLKDVDGILVITNDKFASRFKKWRDAQPQKKRILVLDDHTRDNATRMGSMGDMYYAIKQAHIKEDALVIGGDNLFEEDLKNFVTLCRKKKAPVVGAYLLKKKQEAVNYGVLKIDRTKRIVDFQEKPAQPKSKLVATCLYCFPKEYLSFIKKYLSQKDQARDAMGSYIDWLRKNTAVYAYIFTRHWFDIGDPFHYKEAQDKFSPKTPSD